MDELVAASGPIESVEVVSSVDYSTSRLAGFHGATVDIKIVQHDGTTETISWARVRMIYKRDAWRISDLVPPERIKDSEPPLPQSDRSE